MPAIEALAAILGIIVAALTIARTFSQPKAKGDIIEGSFCTETFYSFIGSVLDNMNPYPAPNSVIVMDNCRIHKHPEILDLIVSRYV